MREEWVMTWHENKLVNPGVPDLSFVMKGGGYETGWLELKSETHDGICFPLEYTVEASQHNWIRRHCTLAPVYFLLGSPHHFWVLDGQYHHLLAAPIPRDQLELYAEAQGHILELQPTLAVILRKLTDRVKRIR